MGNVNLKKVIVALVLVIVGILMAIGDTSEKGVWLSIGCSLLASSMVILLNAMFVDAKQENPLDPWKLDKIFSTRSEKNRDSDPKLKKLTYQLDGVAFGLKTFRTTQKDVVEDCLRRGVNIRLITMAPESPFVKQREIEEKENEGQIKNTIEQLIQWANSLNDKGYKGKIIVRGYDCMTLDFYWRMDDEIYMGPYWYGRASQQTITYKFARGGKGFDLYEKYFDDLWNDNVLLKPLSKIQTFS